jgi:hypothetical protein
MEKIIYYRSDCQGCYSKIHEFVVSDGGLHCRKCFYFIDVQDSHYDEIINFYKAIHE